MRIIAYISIVIGCVLIQSNLIDLISIKNIKPDLLLIVLIWLGQREGQFVGTIGGFFIGLIQDIFETQFLGLSSLCKSIAGFIAGRMKTKEREPNLINIGTFIFIIGLLHNIIYYSIRLLGSGYGFLIILFRFILPETFYTLVFGLIIFSLLPQKWFRFQGDNERI